METRKLKQKLHEIDSRKSADSENFQADFSASTSEARKDNGDVMQLQSTKKRVSRKPRSFKSKDKDVGSDNSKKAISYGRKRSNYSDVYDGVEAKFSVMERAERVLANLQNEFPHFLKCMLPSNVAHGFWLHLPKKFCCLHLPNRDTSVVLVDEWGNEYQTSYLLGRHGLSAGWRGFSISHRLLKGDILIFHLIEPCKLKVHIVRVNSADVVRAAICLMSLDPSRRGTDADNFVKKERKRGKTKYVDVEPFLDTFTSSENVKGKNIEILKPSEQSTNSDVSSSKGCEILNPPQPNDVSHPETSFLHDRSREVITCR
ncbi:hypothetical protein CDL12_12071 [Handroanthus impetiginosus]|uniref:TF-B3 domain-containing protein n=1 Tax=Handroanthus impetiginosus TaxID=429701 RepID=A0A2G9HCQ1_9LAMI|nr:hypothetical protein CDL12_12071 [Handroanthus impetiginosus]